MVELNHKRYQNKHTMSARAVIHINGKDYDASSGEALAQNNTESSVAKPQPARPMHHAKPARLHSEPRRSTTLARSSVHKPKIRSIISNTPVLVSRPKADVEPEHHSSHSRLSPKVMHFAKIEPRMIDTSSVAPPPQAYPDSPPPIVHYRAHSKKEAHIKRQLAASNAHKAVPHKRLHHHTPLRRRAPALAAGIAVLVLITGFVVYQSIPGLSVNLASRQAGFSAALPKYTPGGFKMSGPVEYGKGRVVLSFKSNTDDRHYRIEQKPSLLTDTELKEQMAESTSGKFQAFKQDGQAIFITADSATWTKDGVLFSLKGESGLSSTQIASIASSL